MTIKVLKLLESNDADLLSLAKGLKLLTKLHVTGGYSVDITQLGCVQIIREAHQLSYLYINVPDFEFDVNAYKVMLKIIQNRSEQIKLKLKFHSYGHQQFYPDDAICSNDKWLSVKEIMHPNMR